MIVGSRVRHKSYGYCRGIVAAVVAGELHMKTAYGNLLYAPVSHWELDLGTVYAEGDTLCDPMACNGCPNCLAPRLRR